MSHAELETFRRDAALAILLKMLGNGGERQSKIEAAVAYANGRVVRLRDTATEVCDVARIREKWDLEPTP